MIEEQFGLSAPLCSDPVELFKTGSANPLERLENPADVPRHLHRVGELNWANLEFS